ncbi:hypothetical protein P691DRAFT_799222 [Macrolepiota fuliginosa MF-IS2]|uniref:Uncharacterized protein n=1 Tax=Macrolepiota fuliginosa MF-IS2 TaxID=1400762 RepID=A0A9P5X086_9AGAR|nr:hypothetical protein P691DRAFT_799222 [Macrolepiota fuliginosa MF-IS2]
MPFPRKKVKRNTCGLRDQSTPFQDTNEPGGDGPCDGNGSPAGQEPEISHPDDIRPCWSEEDLDDDMGYMDDPGIDDEMCRSGLQVRMFMLAMEFGDDPRDEDWVPPKLRRRKAKERIGRPETYVKGPDLASKSKWTFYHYKDLLEDQTTLEDCGFVPIKPLWWKEPNLQETSSLTSELDEDSEDSYIGIPDIDVVDASLENPKKRKVGTDAEELDDIGDSVGHDEGLAMETWEEELEGNAGLQQMEKWGWNELQEQIKADLEKNYKRLSLSQINQLMILRNFANLQTRGWLGGEGNAHSLLKDESILGSVTPQTFHRALCDEIFPLLGGVYMDGHEHEDVVKYRNEIFLPMMEEFECQMAHYVPNSNGELEHVEPSLAPGEREVIAEFQDETCCHANEYASSAWLRGDQQPLRKKGHGRLIHNSDFIEQVNGWLVVKNEDGSIQKSARKIIFPGSNGDPWWDCSQLIEQVQTQAIPIFEEAHPGCQALFVFDQSSAHAALPPDALKAFEMNKGNGGKQCQQCDTVIPQSNIHPEFCGKVQKMTTDDGLAKGLQQTLEEHGFKVSHLKAKCSPYWGWYKYCYQQAPKNTFDGAKKATYVAFDACPVDSWRFMSAYHVGLTGKAATWAVCKQKGHHSVS